jgi:signal transduction histidine kinase
MKNRYKTFFDKADNIFVLFDKNLNLLEVNDKVYDVFKITPEQLDKQNICVLFPTAQAGSELLKEYKRVIETGEDYICDDFVPHPKVGILNFKIRAFKVGDGLGIIIRNITELKDSIDDLNRFSYHTTHDIRSPIVTTLGLVNVAKGEAKDNETLKYFELIGRQVQRMDLIVLNLFELSSIKND